MQPGKKKMTKKKSQTKGKIGETLSSDNSSDEVDKFFDEENIFSLLKIEWYFQRMTVKEANPPQQARAANTQRPKSVQQW